MKKIIIAAVVLAAFILTSCTGGAEVSEPSASTEATQSQKPEIIHNTPQEFEDNMQGDFLLLDVRTQEEYDAGHIEGSTLIPVDELESRLGEIADYKDKTVLVYCRSGNRSVTASNILLDNGFTKVHNLLGGIGAWNQYKDAN